MKQKVVIRVCMNDDKSRKKALQIVVGYRGFESTALKGPEKDQIEVIGDWIDAAGLATKLRKKVGFAEIVSVGPVSSPTPPPKPPPPPPPPTTTTPPPPPPCMYNGMHYGYVCELRDQSYDPNCCFM